MFIFIKNNVSDTPLPDDVKNQICDKFFSVAGTTVFLGLWVIFEQVLPYIKNIEGNSISEILHNKIKKYHRYKNSYNEISDIEEQFVNNLSRNNSQEQFVNNLSTF
jgi:hypothetical protein